jgi:hypothetical protein
LPRRKRRRYVTITKSAVRLAVSNPLRQPVQETSIDMSTPSLPRLFNLQAYGIRTQLHYVVITPEGTDPNMVYAAWAYAVRYTAKGLDLPDHEAAIRLMMQRHPSWKLINSIVQNVPIDLSRADQDIQENQ